jgi:negative regulator of sigma E activity
VTALSLAIAFGAALSAVSQAQPSSATVLRGIDTAVEAREAGLLSYTVTEHYVVFRNKDLDHPAAEMTVKTTYQRDQGKSYEVVSETGSDLLRKEVLGSILDNERRMSQPVNRATAILTSANYNMTVKGSDTVDGRNCVTVSLDPKRDSPYLFKGTIWVDAQDQTIVQLQGTAAKSPSVFAGPTQVLRQYAKIGGFPMATHAKAVSNSWLLGQTTIQIDYSDYAIVPQPGR